MRRTDGKAAQVVPRRIVMLGLFSLYFAGIAWLSSDRALPQILPTSTVSFPTVAATELWARRALAARRGPSLTMVLHRSASSCALDTDASVDLGTLATGVVDLALKNSTELRVATLLEDTPTAVASVAGADEVLPKRSIDPLVRTAPWYDVLIAPNAASTHAALEALRVGRFSVLAVVSTASEQDVAWSATPGGPLFVPLGTADCIRLILGPSFAGAARLP